jgi:hypothetical protein
MWRVRNALGLRNRKYSDRYIVDSAITLLDTVAKEQKSGNKCGAVSLNDREYCFLNLVDWKPPNDEDRNATSNLYSDVTDSLIEMLEDTATVKKADDLICLALDVLATAIQCIREGYLFAIINEQKNSYKRIQMPLWVPAKVNAVYRKKRKTSGRGQVILLDSYRKKNR